MTTNYLLLVAVAIACLLVGCAEGWNDRHLMDRGWHRIPPEWMYDQDPNDWDVALKDGTTYYRLVDR